MIMLNEQTSMILRDCAAGEDAEIVDVLGDSAVAVRLRELGMVGGAHVRVIHRGNPMIIELGNTRFCLRGSEAALVRVAVRLSAPLVEDISHPLSHSS